MTKPVGVGVIGCGSVFEYYLDQMRELGESGLLEIKVGYDVAPRGEAYFRKELPTARFAESEDGVIAAEDVDLILVLTSMQEHGRLATSALEQGKHVLVEKPMATTLEEARSLLDVAHDAPGLLMCAPFVVLSDTYQKIWGHVNRKEIGRIHVARALYGSDGPTWGPWYFKEGGGTIFDQAVYNITSLTGFLGPARRVQAMTGIAVREREIEGVRLEVGATDNAQILIEFDDVCFASVATSFTMRDYRIPTIELYGEEGTIHLLGDDWEPHGYEMSKPGSGWQVFAETDSGWPWTDGIRHTIECITNGRRPDVRPDHAFHVLEIMTKAQESGQDGGGRLVESTFEPMSFDSVGLGGEESQP